MIERLQPLLQNKSMAKSHSKSKSKKNYIASIALCTIGLAASLLSYAMLSRGYISKDDLINITAVITDKGEYEETSLPRRDPETGIRERTITKYYFIRLQGLEQRLSYVNLSEEYSKLDQSLSIGDNITISYSPVDNDIFEIKKGAQSVLTSDDKRLRSKIGGFAFGIGALLIFVYAIRIWPK